MRLFSKPCVSEVEEYVVVVGEVGRLENSYPESENVDEVFKPVGFADVVGVCFRISDFFFCSRVFLCFAMLKA